MKINIFSPLPPANTEIANNTMQLLPALSQLAEVTLWIDQDTVDPEVTTFGNLRRYSPEEIEFIELNSNDVTFYHLGNNPYIHYNIWKVSQRHPGIVILHDLVLQGIFLNQLLWWGNAPMLYRNKMLEYYGSNCIADVQLIIEGQMDVGVYLSLYPFFELGLENALGVVVHNYFAFNSVAGRGSWPVCHIPLSFSPPSNHLPDKSVNSPFRLVAFGHLGANRRIDVLLKALARLPDRDRFHLDILGKLYVEGIPDLIKSLDLERIVTLHGFVSEDKLCQVLACADLAINLRYPTMGETSASQLRIWGNKLTSLVTRVGWYGELSEDVVAFVRHDHEIEDIQHHLLGFLDNPQQFTTMGENGYRYLVEHHSPENYASRLIDFAGHVRQFRLCHAANTLADKVGQLLGPWISIENSKSNINKVARQIGSFTGADCKW